MAAKLPDESKKTNAASSDKTPEPAISIDSIGTRIVSVSFNLSKRAFADTGPLALEPSPDGTEVVAFYPGLGKNYNPGIRGFDRGKTYPVTEFEYRNIYYDLSNRYLDNYSPEDFFKILNLIHSTPKLKKYILSNPLSKKPGMFPVLSSDYKHWAFPEIRKSVIDRMRDFTDSVATAKENLTRFFQQPLESHSYGERWLVTDRGDAGPFDDFEYGSFKFDDEGRFEFIAERKEVRCKGVYSDKLSITPAPKKKEYEDPPEEWDKLFGYYIKRFDTRDNAVKTEWSPDRKSYRNYYPYCKITAKNRELSFMEYVECIGTFSYKSTVSGDIYDRRFNTRIISEDGKTYGPFPCEPDGLEIRVSPGGKILIRVRDRSYVNKKLKQSYRMFIDGVQIKIPDGEPLNFGFAGPLEEPWIVCYNEYLKEPYRQSLFFRGKIFTGRIENKFSHNGPYISGNRFVFLIHVFNYNAAGKDYRYILTDTLKQIKLNSPHEDIETFSYSPFDPDMLSFSQWYVDSSGVIDPLRYTLHAGTAVHGPYDKASSVVWLSDGRYAFAFVRDGRAWVYISGVEYGPFDGAGLQASADGSVVAAILTGDKAATYRIR